MGYSVLAKLLTVTKNETDLDLVLIVNKAEFDFIRFFFSTIFQVILRCCHSRLLPRPQQHPQPQRLHGHEVPMMENFGG